MRKPKPVSKDQLNLRLGRQRRDRGTAQRNHRDPMFHDHAMNAIRATALLAKEFTSDDVQKILTVTPTHVNSIGAVFHAAASRGIIERVGYRQSERPEAHARVVAVYRGTEAFLSGQAREPERTD